MSFPTLESREEIAREAPRFTAPMKGAVRWGAKWRYTLLGLYFKKARKGGR